MGNGTLTEIDRRGYALARTAAVAALLLAEGLLIFVHVRDPVLSSLARFGIAFLALFLAIACSRGRVSFTRFAAQRFAWSALVLHLLAASIVYLSPARFAGSSGMFAAVFLAAWICSALAMIALAALTLVRWQVLPSLLRAAGNSWVYAAVLALVAAILAPAAWRVWDHGWLKLSTALTFGLVKWTLKFFSLTTVADPTTFQIGTTKYSVIVGGQCSGWEGVMLALLFSGGWLFIFRRDYRFPQALLLIPVSMLAMFALNVVRIATLIMIGHAGLPRVAMGGFHSQAGWIAFNAVALGFCWAAPRISWVRHLDSTEVRQTATLPNPSVPYLLPFALILAAGMVSRAASDRFELLYPLRFLAAAGALLWFRRKYRELNWRVSLFAPCAGTLVFLLWLALDRSSPGDNAIFEGLSTLSPTGQFAWIAFRVLAATVTVPLAEELAFRGFALRRFISSDFEGVSCRRYSALAVVGSSVAFGLLHGDRWIAGTLAGLLFAVAMLRKGSIGDAVVAHATANALLAVWVLQGHLQFQ